MFVPDPRRTEAIALTFQDLPGDCPQVPDCFADMRPFNQKYRSGTPGTKIILDEIGV